MKEQKLPIGTLKKEFTLKLVLSWAQKIKLVFSGLSATRVSKSYILAMNRSRREMQENSFLFTL